MYIITLYARVYLGFRIIRVLFFRFYLDGGVSCSISGETLVDGLCKCGSSASCTYQSTGSYCDSANSECKCSENKPACPGSAICSNGQCLGKLHSKKF